MARKAIKAPIIRKRVSFTCPDEDFTKFEALAREDGRSVSSALARVIKEYVEDKFKENQ
jgi:hypothetical protein